MPLQIIRQDITKMYVDATVNTTNEEMENASHRYSSAEIKAKIRRQTEKYGWEFIFLAANIDAVATAEHIGIRREWADTLMKREYMEAMCERTGEQWQL